MRPTKAAGRSSGSSRMARSGSSGARRGRSHAASAGRRRGPPSSPPSRGSRAGCGGWLPSCCTYCREWTPTGGWCGCGDSRDGMPTPAAGAGATWTGRVQTRCACLLGLHWKSAGSRPEAARQGMNGRGKHLVGVRRPALLLQADPGRGGAASAEHHAATPHRCLSGCMGPGLFFPASTAFACVRQVDGLLCCADLTPRPALPPLL